MKVGPLLTESGSTISARTPKKAQVGLLFEEVGPLLAECDPTFSAESARKAEVGSVFANVTPTFMIQDAHTPEEATGQEQRPSQARPNHKRACEDLEYL